MPQPSAASLKEYERLSRFVFAAMQLIADSGEFPTLGAFPTEEEWALRMADVKFSEKLSGMRAAAHDMVEWLEMLIEWQPDATPEQLDAKLAAGGAPTFSEMRERRWQTISAILRRKRIDTEDEHRLVLAVLSDVGPSGPTPEERDVLNTLVLRPPSKS